LEFGGGACPFESVDAVVGTGVEVGGVVDGLWGEIPVSHLKLLYWGELTN
jgi:hypothetical protein